LQLWVFLVFVNNVITLRGPVIHSSATVIAVTAFMILLNLKFWSKKYVALFFGVENRWWRTAKRFNKCMGLSLRRKHFIISSSTHNISETGAFIMDDPDLDLNKKYHMHIYVDNMPAIRGICRAVRRGIGHAKEKGLGIHFLKFEGASKSTLKKYLAQIGA